MGKIVFRGASSPTTIDAEIMTTEPNRERGLMYRKSLPELSGMLFVFEEEEPRSFWMHNTCLPLDMMFVAADGFITGIIENAPTLNDDPRGVACRAKYVIETNAGFSRRHGIKAGQSVTIPSW